LGSAPYSAPSDPLAVFKGSSSKERAGGESGMEGKVREWGGK